MILKTYFDGGNQDDSEQYDVITLAAVSGVQYQWVPFAKEWRRILKKHGAPFLHTTDAAGLTGLYSRRNGWSEKRRDALIMDCVRVAGRHIARPNRPSSPGKFGLLPFTVTMVLKDFVRARQEIPGLPTTASEACVMQALHECLLWGLENAQVERFHLVFDRGEPFYGHVVDRTRSRKAVRTVPVLKTISETFEENMRNTPPLQLSDLYAWCVSHKDKDAGFKWQEKLLKMDRMDQWRDYKVLTNVIPGVADLVQSCKLPPRRPSR